MPFVPFMTEISKSVQYAGTSWRPKIIVTALNDILAERQKCIKAMLGAEETEKKICIL